MSEKYMAKQTVDTFESTEPLFTQLYIEIKALAMKKPEATVSKTKVSFVNRMLKDIRDLLKSEDFGKYLDLLDDDQLPQYSDILLIMSHYQAALSTFKGRYYYYDSMLGESAWFASPK